MLRGANKEEIFHDDVDCLRFMVTIEKYKIKSGMKVYAWCLMGNHVHFLVKEGNEDISITMKRIGVSFVSYYNWKYDTVGHLFQDWFRSENVETDLSLVKVARYIHQNPVKAGIVNRPDEWIWSSCHSYYSEAEAANAGNLLDINFILGKFSTDLTIAKEKFKEFNEENNHDDRLNDSFDYRSRLTDEEAKLRIKNLLDKIEIAQVKSLPKSKRNEVLRKVKEIEGLSQRQAARILGISPSLVFKA
nr:transposase [Oceanobacillus saliphilus]